MAILHYSDTTVLSANQQQALNAMGILRFKLVANEQEQAASLSQKEDSPSLNIDPAHIAANAQVSSSSPDTKQLREHDPSCLEHANQNEPKTPAQSLHSGVPGTDTKQSKAGTLSDKADHQALLADLLASQKFNDIEIWLNEFVTDSEGHLRHPDFCWELRRHSLVVAQENKVLITPEADALNSLANKRALFALFSSLTQSQG